MNTKTVKNLTAVALCAIALCVENNASAVIYTINGPVISPVNGHTYFLLSGSTWQEAEATAVQMGGHLATIRSAQEDAWVWSTFNSLAAQGTLFYGYTDAAVEGQWVWTSGEATTYTHWAPNEPLERVYYEDYLNVFPASHGYAGSWNDCGLYDVGSGVVEIVPEPASLSLLGLGAFGLLLRRRS